MHGCDAQTGRAGIIARLPPDRPNRQALVFNVAFAIGALAGLRTGEVFALKWAQIDLGTRRIHVRESVKGPLKDKDSRMVPVLDSLLPILREWKLKSGGDGRVIPPMRSDGKKIDKNTPGNYSARC